jgi:hypothetical protein
MTDRKEKKEATEMAHLESTNYCPKRGDDCEMDGIYEGNPGGWSSASMLVCHTHRTFWCLSVGGRPSLYNMPHLPAKVRDTYAFDELAAEDDLLALELTLDDERTP